MLSGDVTHPFVAAEILSVVTPGEKSHPDPDPESK